jgi:hypothetical protein
LATRHADEALREAPLLRTLLEGVLLLLEVLAEEADDLALARRLSHRDHALVFGDLVALRRFARAIGSVGRGLVLCERFLPRDLGVRGLEPAGSG